MAHFDVNNKSVETILSWIANSEIAIPEIQRPFVWNAVKVRDLIDSLYQGYPVGYIITWKNHDMKLKDGSISNGKKILIDGQQRVTALQAALRGEYIVEKNYKKKRIRIAFNPVDKVFEVCNPAIEKDNLWINDISKIFSSNFNAFDFIPKYCEKNNREDKSEINETLTKLRDIKNNNFGVIELSPKLDIEKITDIFIRINSKGVVLSQSDFAMSKISSNENFDGNNIRKIIDYFCHFMKEKSDYENIKQYDTDFSNTEYFNTIKWAINENENIYSPDYTDVLRVAFTSKFGRGKLADLVSLLSGRNFEKREYNIEIEEKSYNNLLKGVLDFVKETNFKRFLMIIKSIGIIDNSLVRSQNALNFAYTLFLTLKDNKIDSAIIEKIVRRWLILSMLTGRYSGSAESKFDYDIKRFSKGNPMEFLENTEAGELADSFWNNILITHLDTSVASSPYFKIFLMAQIKAGSRGFLSEEIDIKSLIEQRGDIHHIFPKKYLQNNNVRDKTEYNQVANYVYMQTEINIKIKDKAPKVYMNEILEQCQTDGMVYGGIQDENKLYENLEENCIPKDIFEMDVANYKDFLAKRRVLMAQKIKEYYLSFK